MEEKLKNENISRLTRELLSLKIAKTMSIFDDDELKQ